MRKFFVSFSIFCALFMAAATVVAVDPPKYAAPATKREVPQYLQDVSVTIRSLRGEGSGAFKVTKDGQVWIWTCGHVVEGNRKNRTVIDGKGGQRTVTEFDDLRVIMQEVEDGETTADHGFKAEVIRYSDSEHGEDLALLRLRSKRFKPANSSVFWLDKKIPVLGTDLYHCGSLLGQFGSNSLTHGVMSQHGRMLNGKVYDQVQCTSFPGSSGGIICEMDTGKYVGMVVRGAGEGFTLIVPVRRMIKWAKTVGVDFALDDSIPVPDDVKLKSVGIETDGGAGGGAGGHGNTNEESCPFKLKKLSGCDFRKSNCECGATCAATCDCGCQSKIISGKK
jgi:hypothetical protein